MCVGGGVCIMLLICHLRVLERDVSMDVNVLFRSQFSGDIDDLCCHLCVCLYATCPWMCSVLFRSQFCGNIDDLCWYCIFGLKNVWLFLQYCG